MRNCARGAQVRPYNHVRSRVGVGPNRRLTAERRHEATNWNEHEHEILWEVGSFVQLILKTNQIVVDFQLPNPTGDIQNNCAELNSYLQGVLTFFKEQTIKLKIESYTSRYSAALKGVFAYEFSQGDFDRIQVLINELRQQIDVAKCFEREHKERLLKKLEKLQSEMHKRMSNLDKFWELIGDAGVAFGKFGNDVKPIVDRIREIAEIVWKTQARTEELPSQVQNKMLDYNSATDSTNEKKTGTK